LRKKDGRARGPLKGGLRALFATEIPHRANSLKKNCEVRGSARAIAKNIHAEQVLTT
jgi:hypothetical protein